MSSMIGKLISTPNFSLMFCVQARCEYRLSMDRPISSQVYAAEGVGVFLKPMNSVVQTGVKSAGCENRISHLPL